METLGLPQWYIFLIGLVMPIIIKFLVGRTWSRNLKSIVAFGISVIIGGVAAYLTGKFDPANVVVTIGTIFTISQLAYDQIFKDLFTP